MKIASVTAAMAAIVAAGSLATPSFAQDYGSYGYAYGDEGRNPCQQAQHDNGTGGGLLGAIAGAVIGGNIAHHGGRTGGAIIGALAGAAIGNNVGRASAKSSGVCEGADQGRYDQVYYSGAAYRTYQYDRGYAYPTERAYDYPRDGGYDRYDRHDAYRVRHDRDGYRQAYDRDDDNGY